MSASTTPDDVRIEPRRPAFDFSVGSRTYWNDNSPAKTFFWNALSIGLPQLEHAAVKTLNAVLPELDDEPALQQCAQAFCMQESQHAIHHEHFNQGFEAAFADGRRGVLVRWERALFGTLLRVMPRRFMLGLFSGVEHFTSIIAHAGLERPARWFSNCDPEVYRLWDWHAVEELEHKSVCFDVYRHLGGGWVQRSLTMLIATFGLLLPVVSLRVLKMLARDGRLFSPSTWRELIGTLIGGRPGHEGVLRTIFGDYCAYFRPGFTPWEQDSRALIADWKQRNAPQAATAAPPRLQSNVVPLPVRG